MTAKSAPYRIMMPQRIEIAANGRNRLQERCAILSENEPIPRDDQGEEVDGQEMLELVPFSVMPRAEEGEELDELETLGRVEPLDERVLRPRRTRR